MYNYQFSDGLHWRLSEADLLAYKDRCSECVPRVEPFIDRISSLVWLGIWALEQRHGVAPYQVLQSVLDVESGEPGAGLKPATRFRRPPLRGLWHKHWFSARFIAGNLLAAIQRENAEDWISGALKDDESQDVAIGRIAHHFTVTSFEDRWASKQATGEWIVYIQRPDGNRYLSVATHTTGDQAIYDSIVNVCGREYPDIADWIAEAAADS